MLPSERPIQAKSLAIMTNRSLSNPANAVTWAEPLQGRRARGQSGAHGVHDACHSVPVTTRVRDKKKEFNSLRAFWSGCRVTSSLYREFESRPGLPRQTAGA